MNFGFEIKITDEDRKRAVAFIPMFPEYYCEEYDFCYCKERTDEPFYVQPKGYIKNHFADYGMAGIDVAGGGILLLPNLINQMINEGVDKKFFQSVLNKRKKIMGYTYISKNILPKASMRDMSYKYLGECPLCGAVKLKKRKNEYYFLTKTINKDALEYLQDVNFTYEFYDEYREIVVSKKMENIISKYVEYAEFIPIF